MKTTTRARIDFRNAVWNARDPEADPNHGLKPLEKHVALAFEKYAGKGLERVWVAQSELQRVTGMSRNGVRLCTRALEQKGWLVLVEKPRQHYSGRYRLTIPQPYLPEASQKLDSDSSCLSQDSSRLWRDASSLHQSPEQGPQQRHEQFRSDERAQHALARSDEDDAYERVRADVEQQVGGFDGMDEGTFFGLYESYDDGTRSEAALVQIITNAMTKEAPWLS